MAWRVLVIEDNVDNLELMRYVLAAFGYQVSCAGDGVAGIEAARREKPDLILCDIQLPLADGYAVLETLKRDPEISHIPLVAVTAYAMVGDREKVMSAGFAEYITKPIDPERFAASIQRFLTMPGGGTPLTANPKSEAETLTNEVKPWQ